MNQPPAVLFQRIIDRNILRINSDPITSACIPRSIQWKKMPLHPQPPSHPGASEEWMPEPLE